MYRGTHGTDESLSRGVAVSFTVKLEVPDSVMHLCPVCNRRIINVYDDDDDDDAQVYILAIFTTFLFPLGTPLGQSR